MKEGEDLQNRINSKRYSTPHSSGNVCLDGIAMTNLISDKQCVFCMDLFILRHGKAEQSSDRADGKRALTADGKDEMRKIGKWMQQKKFRFNVIATSPLTRAYETAEIVARSLGQKERLVVWEELGPGGDLDALSYRASLYGEDAAIILIGHEPMLSTLISRIISGYDTGSLVLAKGGLAKIRNFSFDKRPSGELQWLLTPAQMMEMR
jgi:phosphohistidine phosphatase